MTAVFVVTALFLMLHVRPVFTTPEKVVRSDICYTINQDEYRTPISSEAIMIKQWETLDVVERDSNKVSGAWVFRGTRVPVAALFENLRDGATVEEFLEWFPGVQRSQIEAVLDFEIDALEITV
jgi:uncharacterized protein (DUF433 family)